MKDLIALACGILFGVGLALSGMTDTAKVLGFLDLFGDWQPDLAFVMGGAVCVTLLSFRIILKRERPRLAPSFYLPETAGIDVRLLSGAAIFGIGWGAYGYCPGPAVAALVYLRPESFVFVAAMLTGMFLAGKVSGSAPRPVPTHNANPGET